MRNEGETCHIRCPNGVSVTVPPGILLLAVAIAVIFGVRQCVKGSSGRSLKWAGVDSGEDESYVAFVRRARRGS